MRLLSLLAVIFLSGCLARSSFVDKLSEVALDNAEHIHQEQQTPSTYSTLEKASKLHSEGSSIQLPQNGLGGLEGLLGPFAGVAMAGLAAYQAKQKKAAHKRAEYSIEKARKWARMDKNSASKELEDDEVIPT